MTYDPAKTRDLNADGIADTMIERKGAYLKLATANAFKLRDLLLNTTVLSQPGNFNTPLALDTYVLCDAFKTKKVRLNNGNIVKAGAPILYYRANTSQQIIRGRYRAEDNYPMIMAKQQIDGRVHPLGDGTNQYQFFYEQYIRDPKIEARLWPYRPDSYLLISAGADGLYGTADDIRNFGN